jgi:hypothetical protein
MQPFGHRRLARRAFSLIAILGLLLTALSWYSPQPAHAQTASLLINNHICPDPVSSIDMIDLAPVCQGIGSNWSFVVTHTGGQYQQSIDTDGSGFASFSGMPAGVYRIEGAWTPDFSNTVVYCKVEDGLGNDVVSFFHRPTDLQGNYWMTELEIAQDGYMGYCDWFNYSFQAPETGSVFINKIDCPTGFDAYSASIFDLAANCHDQDIYNFTMVDANGGNWSGSTPGSGLNSVGWDGVPKGPMLITEDVPGNYGEPRVFCKNQKLTGEEDPEEEVIVNNGAINPTLKVGYDNLYCDWFNIPGPAGVTIYINKLQCPDGFISSDPNELAANCNEPYDPVTFKLDGASSGNPGDQETGSVVPNGVQWTDMDADTWYITEFLPDGLGEPIVFCKLTNTADNSETDYLQQPVEFVDDGYRLTYTVDAGFNLYCDWFNVTDTPYVGIYIHKYGCPEGYDQSWSLEQWSQYCTTIVRDAIFDVQYSDGTSYEQPLSGIDAWWELLPPGQYQITEQQPSGWTASVIFCAVGSYKGDLGSYSPVDVSQGGFSWDLGDYEYIDCYWYNLAKPRPVATVDPNAPATLTIVKYTCPEDYDPLELEADPNKDCDDLTDDVTFAVVGSQNASVEGVTGDDGEGTVTFSGLKPGNYLLRESYPEDVEQAFIWTCDSDFRTFNYPFAPFARIDHTGTIKISLIAGETLTCTWFNVPSPPEISGTPSDGDVDITISVFECAAGAVNPSACDPAGEGIGVTLTAISGDEDPIDLETDQEGVAVGSVAADEYDIEADDTICFADSAAFTQDGTLDLTDGDPVDVSIYLCTQ